MRKIIVVGVLLAWAFVPPSATAGRPLHKVPQIKFIKYKLKNGLEVILHQDKSLPLVAVNVWYHVGAVDETIGILLFDDVEELDFAGPWEVFSAAHQMANQMASQTAGEAAGSKLGKARKLGLTIWDEEAFRKNTRV